MLLRYQDFAICSLLTLVHLSFLSTNHDNHASPYSLHYHDFSVNFKQEREKCETQIRILIIFMEIKYELKKKNKRERDDQLKYLIDMGVLKLIVFLAFDKPNWSYLLIHNQFIYEFRIPKLPQILILFSVSVFSIKLLLTLASLKRRATKIIETI